MAWRGMDGRHQGVCDAVTSNWAASRSPVEWGRKWKLEPVGAWSFGAPPPIQCALCLGTDEWWDGKQLELELGT